MNDTKLLPDDPRITAYALGELSGDERAAVEAALRENPALRALVEDVRATARHLEAALAAEPAMDVDALIEFPNSANPLNGHAVRSLKHPDFAAAAILPGNDPTKLDGGNYRSPHARGKLLKFPQLYVVIGGMAAACFAVLVALNRDAHNTKQQALATEVRIAQQRKAAEAKKAAPPPVLVLRAPSTPGESPSRDFSAGVETSDPAVLLSSTTSEPGGSQSDGDRPASGTSSPKTFIFEGGFSLAEQGRDASLPSLRPSELSPGSSLIAGNTYTLTTGATGHVGGNPAGEATPGVVTIGTANGTTPAETSGGVAVHLPAQGGAPDVTAPSKVANVAAGGRTVPGNAGPGLVGLTGSAPFVPGPGDEIVLLDAFTVTADPIINFSALAYLDRMGTVSRGLIERKELPRPPVGAQFGRNSVAAASVADNPFRRVSLHPQSTFSATVDTAGYATVRRMIEQGSMPARDAVRIEEMLNYFPYRYPAPVAERGEAPPFAASLEVADAPWSPTHRLVRIGLKGRESSAADRARANLVFLIDVSASMADANKLPLIKESMRALIGRLRPDDCVAIVVYAGAAGLVLPSTPVSKSPQILAALDTVRAGTSPKGAMGLPLAYETAKAKFVSGGHNRVILCTDDGYKIGSASDVDLIRLIGERAASGVFLTALGFGMGHAKDATLERFALRGNGTYGYVDTRREAEQLLVEQVTRALVTVAKDVKIQVEFNPARVSSYRLIGYENRLLRKEDFNDDRVDAGEIGAGHTVTALYEIVPIGADEASATASTPDDLKYQAKGVVSSRLELPDVGSNFPVNQMLAVRVRYKKPDGFLSHTQEFRVIDAGAQFANASADFRFAAAVAQFGMILRDSPHRGTGTLGDVLAWAATAAGPVNDPRAYRGEFLDLVRKTQRLLR